MNVKELQKKSYSLRKDVIEMVFTAGSGHIGGALGMADVMSVLFFEVLNYKSNQPKWSKRDYFILSNGHTCPIFYAALAETGFFEKKELKTLRKLGFLLQGHPHVGISGIEVSSGPLGQGISQATGLAASLKRDNKTNKVFCYVGDGEIEEGQCWEAALFAQKEKLDNLVVIVDRNKIQIDGNTKDVIHIGDVVSKFRAFDFRVIEIDAHNISQIRTAFQESQNMKDKPICIVANSIPGRGVSFMEGNYKWHGGAPNREERDEAVREIEHIIGGL